MAGQKQVHPKAPLAGALAAPLHGSYKTAPGGPDGPEYFGPDLAGMCAAVSRAKWLSVGGPAQQVTALHSGHSARLLFEYAGGICTARPACVVPGQPRTPADT